MATDERHQGMDQDDEQRGSPRAGIDAALSLCVDHSPDFDDPEGWMLERINYWADVAPPVPSRAALLRYRFSEAWRAWLMFVRRPQGEKQVTT